MVMTVRTATPADVQVIIEFNRLLALESEGKTLDGALLATGVQAALADPHKGWYFLAEKEGLALGQMAVTFEWSDWRNGWFWWIQSVYVRSDWRRCGVFRTLFDHVRQAAAQDPSVIGLRLYVDDDNHPAHHTYQAMGLDWTSYRVMEEYPLG